MTRKVVYQEHHLFVLSRGYRTEAVSSQLTKEQKKRIAERELYMELSRYYLRKEGRWKVPGLLSEGNHGRFLCTEYISLTDSFYQF